MDVDFQYELYNEWVESKEKITLAEFCYKKGRKDAIEEFAEELYSMTKNYTEWDENEDVLTTKRYIKKLTYEYISAIAEELKEGAE